MLPALRPESGHHLMDKDRSDRILRASGNLNGGHLRDISCVCITNHIPVRVLHIYTVHNSDLHPRGLCNRVQRALCLGGVARFPVGLVFHKPRFCGLFGSRRAVIRNARLVGRSSEIGRHVVDLVRLLWRDLAGGGVVRCHKAVIEIRQRFRRRVLRCLAKRRCTVFSKGVRYLLPAA